MADAKNDYNKDKNISFGEKEEPNTLWAQWAIGQVNAVQETIGDRSVVNCKAFERDILASSMPGG